MNPGLYPIHCSVMLSDMSNENTTEASIMISGPWFNLPIHLHNLFGLTHSSG